MCDHSCYLHVCIFNWYNLITFVWVLGGIGRTNVNKIWQDKPSIVLAIWSTSEKVISSPACVLARQHTMMFILPTRGDFIIYIAVFAPIWSQRLPKSCQSSSHNWQGVYCEENQVIGQWRGGAQWYPYTHTQSGLYVEYFALASKLMHKMCTCVCMWCVCVCLCVCLCVVWVCVCMWCTCVCLCMWCVVCVYVVCVCVCMCVAANESADIETLVDDFVTFYVAGKQVMTLLTYKHIHSPHHLLSRSGDHCKHTVLCCHTGSPASWGIGETVGRDWRRVGEPDLCHCWGLGEAAVHWAG